MILMFEYFSYVFGGIGTLFLITFILVSLLENEKHAAIRAFQLLAGIFVLSVVAIYLPFSSIKPVLIALGILSILSIFVLLIPYHFTQKHVDKFPKLQIDERDIMFSRRLLQPGDERYQAYYDKHPEYKQVDDEFRKNAGLLGVGSRFYEQLQFNAAQASFETISGLHHLAEQPDPQCEKSSLSRNAHTLFIKKWSLKLGAHSVGITRLQWYHKYSHVGRGPDFGLPVKLEHKYAIALTVEMDKTAMDAAPFAPTVMESAQQYVHSGVVAIQIAEFIRGLGYPARAHIDGNYRVVCPLVARDAGLGEIGRMGLLMTPKLGPRVRIAVVTTDLSLDTEIYKEDESVHEFCMRCKKCAEVCPSKSISFTEPQEVDGSIRWQINQEACFTYWTVAGTDCGRCVSICPYAHANNLMHNMVRKGLRQSSAFQIAALKMDDFFYGRRPSPKIKSITENKPAKI